MKKILILLIFMFILLIPKASAHLPGQPSYFKINNEYTSLYPFPSNAPKNIELPQDKAPRDYFVNQKLYFEIDTQRFLNALPSQIEKTKFYWKFGDGDIAEGLKNTHVYKKPGTYLLKINADDGITPAPQLFESVEMKILPEKVSNSSKTFIYLIPVIIFTIVAVLRIKPRG